MKPSKCWMVVILIIAVLQLSACTQASETETKVEPVHVEDIEGSDLKRVALTEEAAQRLGLEMAPVRDEQVTRKRIVGGEVVAVPEEEADDANSVYVRVRLNESDLNKIDRSQSALILPEDGNAKAPGLAARSVERLAVGDPEEEATAALYYEVESADHGLAPGQRVRVELTLAGSGAQRQVVPYAAVIYDVNGGTWVYISPEPLVFVRHPISVDYIDSDTAVLSEGLPSDTEVVTVGAAELYGSEFEFEEE